MQISWLEEKRRERKRKEEKKRGEKRGEGEERRGEIWGCTWREKMKGGDVGFTAQSKSGHALHQGGSGMDV